MDQTIMKKAITAACAMAFCLPVVAQVQTLKEAERMLKVEVPDHRRIASMLDGAKQDPTTANDVKTWFLAGKNGFQTWTTGFEQWQQGAQPDKTAMSKALISGYDDFMKALPMDTIIDEKGKTKTKYSKEIVKTIAANAGSFHDAGVFLYEANDLGGAYRAWDIYSGLPTLAVLGKEAPAADNDSVQGATYYNMGIFAYQADMKPEALSAFLRAARKGHGDVAYDNALAMANEIGDREVIQEVAEEAFAKYGKQSYIAELVNLYIREKDYDKALEMINRAIDNNPSNSILYNVKGVLIENTVNEDGIDPEVAAKANENAIQLYRQAVDLDGENAEARYNLGRMIANKAYKLSDDSYDLPTPEFNALRENTIEPMFHQAIEQLEKAIAINKDVNRQAYSILKNLYYNLKDEENMERVRQLEMD